MDALQLSLSDFSFFTKNGKQELISRAITDLGINEVLVVAEEEVPFEIIHSFTTKMLRDVLEKDWIVMYKREAKHGFDIQLFSKSNLYTLFFYQLQRLVPKTFRFFSINGKRISSEKQFFFETWTLHKPPHGFEEVFPESVL